MRSRAAIEKEVAKVRRKHNVNALPVNVQAVAESMGVRVQMEALEPNDSGALFAQDGNTVMAVNRSHAPRRQRFTMAHELGHLVLHVKPDAPATAFVDGALSFQRNAASGEGVKDVEIEANAFAAELLMPRAEVEKLVRENGLDLHDEVALRKASGIFGVSEQALTVRLVSLGLVTMWDEK